MFISRRIMRLAAGMETTFSTLGTAGLCILSCPWELYAGCFPWYPFRTNVPRGACCSEVMVAAVECKLGAVPVTKSPLSGRAVSEHLKEVGAEPASASTSSLGEQVMGAGTETTRNTADMLRKWGRVGWASLVSCWRVIEQVEAL